MKKIILFICFFPLLLRGQGLDVTQLHQSVLSRIDSVSKAKADSIKGTVSTSFKYTKEWHVATNGNDITGDGSENKPYLTIQKALNSAGNSGEQVVIHSGTYTENITVSKSNLTLAAAQTTQGGEVFINGIVTCTQSSSSISNRFYGLSIADVVHNAAGGLYFSSCQIKNSYSNTTSGYNEFVNCELSGTISATGSGQFVISNSKVSALPTINNASCTFAVRDAPILIAPTLTTGTLFISNATVYATTTTSASITTASGTLLYLQNSQVVKSDNSIGKLTIAGNYSILNTSYDYAASTITGTNIQTQQSFDNVRLIATQNDADNSATNVLVRNSDGSIEQVAKSSLTLSSDQQIVVSTSSPSGTPSIGTHGFVTSTGSLGIPIMEEYIYTGSVNGWVKIDAPRANYGDVKQSIVVGDHYGWVKLDGRAKSTLSSSQQTRATALGIGTNLPDASNAFLVQNGSTLGAVSGSNSRTIAQNQLPNITPSITVANGGEHEHPIAVTTDNFGWANNAPKVFKKSMGGLTNERDVATSDRGATGYETTGIIGLSGIHAHTATATSINGGVTQQTFDVTPRSMSVNTFIYLGN